MYINARIYSVPEDSKIIFTYPDISVAYKNHSFFLQIIVAVEIIIQFTIKVEKHGINSQISSIRVQLPILRKFYLRVSSISQDVDSQSSNLKVLLVVYSRCYRPMLLPFLIYHSDLLLRKHLLHLLRRSIGCEIKILGLFTHENIANGAAGDS